MEILLSFYRLWLRYDFHHTGLVNYKEFLSRLGVSAINQGRPPVEGAKGGKPEHHHIEYIY
jgi:hypothetical protein